MECCVFSADVPNAEVQLPLLNVEDADEDSASVENRPSRRPSRQTIADAALIIDGATPTISEQSVENIGEMAAHLLSQLEPEVVEVQLVEVCVVIHLIDSKILRHCVL
jgi:hypothetical protein